MNIFHSDLFSHLCMSFLLCSTSSGGLQIGLKLKGVHATTNTNARCAYTHGTCTVHATCMLTNPGHQKDPVMILGFPRGMSGTICYLKMTEKSLFFPDVFFTGWEPEHIVSGNSSSSSAFSRKRNMDPPWLHGLPQLAGRTPCLLSPQQETRSVRSRRAHAGFNSWPPTTWPAASPVGYNTHPSPGTISV